MRAVNEWVELGDNEMTFWGDILGISSSLCGKSHRDTKEFFHPQRNGSLLTAIFFPALISGRHGIEPRMGVDLLWGSTYVPCVSCV